MIDFSVIIPVKNAEKTIEKCIVHLLNQNYPKDKFEVIVVDNNSSDGAAKKIKENPVKYVLCKKPGSSAARNLGVKKAGGKIMAFIDSGGFADKNWLREAHKFFEENKKASIAGGKMECCEESLIRRTIFNLRLNQRLHTANSFAATGNLFVKKNEFEIVRGFNKAMELGSVDLEFGERATGLGYNPVFLETAIVKYNARNVPCFLKREFRRGQSQSQLDLLRKKNKEGYPKRSHKTISGLKKFVSNQGHSKAEKMLFLVLGGTGKTIWLFGTLFENFCLLVYRKKRNRIIGSISTNKVSYRFPKIS